MGDGAFPLELSSVHDRPHRQGRVRLVGDKAQRLAAWGQNLLARGVATQIGGAGITRHDDKVGEDDSCDYRKRDPVGTKSAEDQAGYRVIR